MSRNVSRVRRLVTIGAVLTLGLAVSPVAQASASLSGTIFYASYAPRDPSTSDLYAIDPDGGGLRQLTHTPNRFEQQPAISRDGSELVYRGSPTLSGLTFELYTADADGGHVRRVTNDSWAEEAPTWTPDGRQIVFASNRNDADHDCLLPPCRMDLYRIAPDGTHLQELTDMPGGIVSFPSVSPDGRTVLFTFLTDAGDTALYTVGIDGHGLHQLTAYSAEYFHGHWSPDGARIAFSDNGCLTCTGANIWTMRADGTQLLRLTHGNPQGNDYNAQWSPDGAWITLTRETPTDEQVYIVRSTGGGLTKLTQRGVDNFESVWGPG